MRSFVTSTVTLELEVPIISKLQNVVIFYFGEDNCEQFLKTGFIKTEYQGVFAIAM